MDQIFKKNPHFTEYYSCFSLFNVFASPKGAPCGRIDWRCTDVMFIYLFIYLLEIAQGLR